MVKKGNEFRILVLAAHNNCSMRLGNSMSESLLSVLVDCIDIGRDFFMYIIWHSKLILMYKWAVSYFCFPFCSQEQWLRANQLLQSSVFLRKILYTGQVLNWYHLSSLVYFKNECSQRMKVGNEKFGKRFSFQIVTNRCGRQ